MTIKWILRFSIALNILFIVALIMVGLNYKVNTVKPLINKKKDAHSLVITHSSLQSNQSKTNQETSAFQWPLGKKIAISFTFDDARLSQIDNGIPLFDEYDVKATFYVSLFNLEKRVDAWKKALSNGHEIGNHTHRHPCTVNYDFTKGRSLEDYSISMMRMDINSENEVLKKIFGVQPVSFAYPCGQKFIGRGLYTKSYVPLISEMFETGRGWLDEGPNDPTFCDLSQLTGMELDGKSFDQIKTIIDSAKKTGKWLILVGHEINEGGNQTSLLSTIESICQYASNPDNGIWIDNIHNIASYIKDKRGEASFVEMSFYRNPIKALYINLWSKYYVYKMNIRNRNTGNNYK